jgi:hypothetical protein
METENIQKEEVQPLPPIDPTEMRGSRGSKSPRAAHPISKKQHTRLEKRRLLKKQMAEQIKAMTPKERKVFFTEIGEDQPEQPAILKTESMTTEEKKEEPKKKATTPWKPAAITEIPGHLKDGRFTYRLCNTQKIGNIQRKLQEGWEIDRILSAKINDLYGGLARTIEDGSPMDSTVRMRELIVMRMPKEMAEARNEYYRKMGQIDRGTIEKGMRNRLTAEQDSENVLGRSTIYSERTVERI